MQLPYVIGVDIGTGSTKAVAVDPQGNVLGTAQHFYGSVTKGRKSEQDVYVVFGAFQKSIREVVTSLQQPPAAISLSSAMHSIMALDESGKPLTPAMLWSDTRASEIAGSLRSSPFGKEIYLATGTPLHSMSPLCKIRWLSGNEPEVFRRAAKFISIKEFIWLQLFGEFVIDHSLASATGLFNIHSLQWEKAALSLARIKPQQLSLPVPVMYTKAGIKAEAAAAMNLPAGTPFIIGGSDGTLANLGTLCLSSSEAAITIGTSAAVRITSTKPVEDVERMIFNYRLDEKMFVCGGAVNNGGNVFQWLLENLFANHTEVKTYEQLFEVISQVAPGSDGLLFLPYLHGERAPIWDERSCGVYMGLSAKHSLHHFARAAAEGVCFALQHVLSSLEEVCGAVQQITISGGLVQSAAIMQLLADITGKNVVVQQKDDASAIGAAYLAQKALRIIDEYASIKKAEEVDFLPQQGVTAHYQRLIPMYKALYPLLKDQMHSLHQLYH
jgi:gluconokinase